MELVFVLFGTAGAVCAGTAVATRLQRFDLAGRLLVAALVTVAWWSLTTVGVLAAGDLEPTLWWVQVPYVAIAALPALLLLFTWAFARVTRALRWFVIALLSLPAAVTVTAAWTSPRHGLLIGFAVSALLLAWAALRIPRGSAPITRTQLLDRMRDPVVVTDERGRVAEGNDSANAVLGCPRREAEGRPAAEVLPGWEHLRRVPDGTRVTLSPPEAAGRVYEVDVNRIVPDSDDDARLLLFRDVTDQVQLHAELERLAVTDPLTGLANRREFLNRLATALRRADRAADLVGLIYLDLDDFKNINDTFGHSIGDRLLEEVARTLTGELRAVDTVGRLGGDEFAVVVDRPTDVADATHTARRLADAIPRALTEAGLPPVAASIGVAVTGADLSASEIIAHADRLMYAAKQREAGTVESTAVALDSDAELGVDVANTGAAPGIGFSPGVKT
ncbi:diguanylate cyclase [Egibacter rhizosphaerae]|nr:diguanylate cyclase [Egibacter rhizosphaerae]